jgi:phosphonate transport system permease protein
MMATLRRWTTPFGLLAVAALYYWAITSIKITPPTRIAGERSIWGIMIREMDWAYTPEMIVMLIETLQMAIVGTLLAAVLAIPFGFLASANIGKRLAGLGKFNLNFIRAFPELLFAVIFIKAVGPGPVAGVLAMGINSVGMLGKLYAEAVEQIDRGPVEALASTGANRVQQIFFAVIPQVVPEFASYVIYRFEINMRAASVLGIVAAGGIGAPLIFALLQREWGRVGIILLGIIVLVSIIDLLSSYLRKRLV